MSSGITSRMGAIACAASGLLLAQAAGSIDPGRDGSDVVRACAAAGLLSAAFLLIAIGGGLVSRRGIRDALGLRAPTPSALEVFAISLGLVGFSVIALFAASAVGLAPSPGLERSRALLSEGTPKYWLLMLASLGLAPALGEELLFRGLVLRGVTAVAGARWGIVSSALLFAAAHPDPALFFVSGLLGAYLAMAVLAGGTVWIAVVAHATNNVVALAAGSLQAGEEPSVLALLAALLAAVVGAFTIAHRMRSASAADARASAGLRQNEES